MYFGFVECCNHWKRTVLLAIQVALLMFLAVILVTTYETQMAKYKPFQEVLGGKGHVVYTVTGFGAAGGIDEYFDGLVKLRAYQYFVSTVVDVGGITFHVGGLSEEAGSYIPPLQAGVWYTEAEGFCEIPVVISPNPLGIGVGDVFTFEVGDGTAEARVCGVLEQGASVFYSSHYGPDSDLFDFYQIYDPEIFDKEYGIFLSGEALLEAGGWPSGQVYIRYEDEISQSEYEKNERYLRDLDANFVEDSSVIRENTERVIRMKILDLLPVMIGAFVLTSFGITCLMAVDTLVNLKAYAVFYTCGMRWRQCIGISGFSALLTGIIGFALMVFLGNLALIIFEDNLFLFELGLSQLLACGGVLMYMILLAGIMPALILRKNPPVTVLKTV